jgi:hypothetical protein
MWMRPTLDEEEAEEIIAEEFRHIQQALMTRLI